MRFLHLFAILILASTAFQGEIIAAPPPYPLPPTSLKVQKDLQAIDKELESLEKELREYRRSMFNAEMNAQTNMLDNWDEFIEDVRISEQGEKHIHDIKERIHNLKKRKAEILQSDLPKK